METSKFLIAAAFFIAAFSFTAQAQSLSENEPDPYNREFGFGTNILLNGIFNSESAPLDFMYRWKSGKGYMRLGADILYSRNDHERVELNADDERVEYLSQALSPTLIMGKEWREEVARRWLLNYGLDLNLSYRHTLSNSTSFDEFRVMEDEMERNTFGVGLRPFVGVLFKINQRMMVGAEASFRSLIQRSNQYTKRISEYKENPENNSISEYEESIWNYSTTTNPASNIFLYYRF